MAAKYFELSSLIVIICMFACVFFKFIIIDRYQFNIFVGLLVLGYICAHYQEGVRPANLVSLVCLIVLRLVPFTDGLIQFSLLSCSQLLTQMIPVADLDTFRFSGKHCPGFMEANISNVDLSVFYPCAHVRKQDDIKIVKDADRLSIWERHLASITFKAAINQDIVGPIETVIVVSHAYSHDGRAYASLARDWASTGVVVICINHSDNNERVP